MPIELVEKQIIKTPSVDVPETEYPLAWASQIHILWDHGTPGSATVELYPLTADRTQILRRNPDGTDAVIHGVIPSMVEAMQRCPELAAVMTPLIDAIDAWNKIAVDDAKKAEAARLAAIAAEEAAIAKIEADRIAAEAARQAAIEAARLAAEEAARISAEEEAARIAAYNTPEAKAARVAAAQAEADAKAAEAQAASAAASAAMTPEIVAALAAQQQIADALAAQRQAEHLQAEAEAAAAEVSRLEAE